MDTITHINESTGIITNREIALLAVDGELLQVGAGPAFSPQGTIENRYLAGLVVHPAAGFARGDWIAYYASQDGFLGEDSAWCLGSPVRLGPVIRGQSRQQRIKAAYEASP
jgi:hypothetical protein